MPKRGTALSVAAQEGHVQIVRMLLDAGEDPNRYNLEGNHAHSTPLHQAVLGGHEAVVRLLIESGARLDTRDAIWHGTPLGWAIYGGGKAQTEMAACLRSLGATE
jgi:ankyrin repeat protein